MRLLRHPVITVLRFGIAQQFKGDVLNKAGYLPSVNLQGGIYTPNGVADELRERNGWRVFWQRFK